MQRIDKDQAKPKRLVVTIPNEYAEHIEKLLEIEKFASASHYVRWLILCDINKGKKK